MLPGGMQVLLVTIATIVLDLYIVQERAAQKGDTVAEAAGSLMLFLGSHLWGDCRVQHRP